MGRQSSSSLSVASSTVRLCGSGQMPPTMTPAQGTAAMLLLLLLLLLLWVAVVVVVVVVVLLPLLPLLLHQQLVTARIFCGRCGRTVLRRIAETRAVPSQAAAPTSPWGQPRSKRPATGVHGLGTQHNCSPAESLSTAVDRHAKFSIKFCRFIMLEGEVQLGASNTAGTGSGWWGWLWRGVPRRHRVALYVEGPAAGHSIWVDNVSLVRVAMHSRRDKNSSSSSDSSS